MLIVQGINMLGITLKQLSPTLKVPMWLVYLAIPVGGTGILLNSLLNIADMGRKSEKGVEA